MLWHVWQNFCLQTQPLCSTNKKFYTHDTIVNNCVTMLQLCCIIAWSFWSRLTLLQLFVAQCHQIFSVATLKVALKIFFVWRYGVIFVTSKTFCYTGVTTPPTRVSGGSGGSPPPPGPPYNQKSLGLPRKLPHICISVTHLQVWHECIFCHFWRAVDHSVSRQTKNENEVFFLRKSPRALIHIGVRGGLEHPKPQNEHKKIMSATKKNYVIKTKKLCHKKKFVTKKKVCN